MNPDSFSEWPPTYHIRTNPKARSVILRVRPVLGLVITIPKGFDRRQLTGILEAHRPWIQERFATINQSSQPGLPADILPEKIVLTAVEQTWEVSYEDQPGAPLEASWNAKPRPHIRIRGAISHVPACCRLLRTWLQHQGKHWLPSWVEKVSQESGLPYRTLTVRCQKTRWGSYSSSGTISLNAAVLLLPQQLVRLIILHELCHGKHGLHDTTFWDLLQHHEPEARRLDAQLQDTFHRFPPWYTASFYEQT